MRGRAFSAKLGTPKHKDVIGKPVRLVIVRRRKTDGTWEELWLVTDHLDMSADLVALAYRYRWTIELFFRWFKCVLGCRHLVSHNVANGMAIQIYAASDRQLDACVVDQPQTE